MSGASKALRDMERLAMAEVASQRNHGAAAAARSQKLATRFVTCLSSAAMVLAVYDLSLLLR